MYVVGHPLRLGTGALHCSPDVEAKAHFFFLHFSRGFTHRTYHVFPLPMNYCISHKDKYIPDIYPVAW